MQIASWNVNSIRARTEHVTRWLQKTNVDVLLLQELKSMEFPFALCEGSAITERPLPRKPYNGVAILSRLPIEMTSRTLLGDEQDSHARFLETRICRLPGGEHLPFPTEIRLALTSSPTSLPWMDRLARQIRRMTV
jgi:exodeoxyribonuclease-3